MAAGLTLLVSAILVSISYSYQDEENLIESLSQGLG